MAMIEHPTLDMERQLAAQGCDVVIGCDEVGRGALAGPVMVGAAAMWSRDLAAAQVPAGVADSKLLTEHRREGIVDELRSWCAAYAVGQASNAEIDEWGISHALGIAALRALNDVERQLGMDGPAGSGRRVDVILDGPNDYITKTMNTFDAPALPIPVQVSCKVKGDRHCATVSCAAVIAKVTRDHAVRAVRLGAQQGIRLGGSPRRHRPSGSHAAASGYVASDLIVALRLIPGLRRAARHGAA